MGGRSYIFLKSFVRGGGEFEILWGKVFLGFGLSGRWDVIWNIP